MKSVESLPLIEKLEEQVEESINIAVRTFQNLPSEFLLKPSETGGWSIAQCLEHLNGYGYFYLPQIQQALERNKHRKANVFFKSGWLGKYFTQMMEPKSGKKYRAAKMHIPSVDLDAYAVVAEFILQQERLLAYLNQAKTTDLAIKVPISISRFIQLKLGDVFQFIIAHNERHLNQAKRNID